MKQNGIEYLQRGDIYPSVYQNKRQGRTLGTLPERNGNKIVGLPSEKISGNETPHEQKRKK